MLTNAHLLTPIAKAHHRQRSDELRADERLRLPMGGRLDRRLILKTRRPGVLPSSSTSDDVKRHRFGQDVNSRIQAAG
jgi:hypothetical protein